MSEAIRVQIELTVRKPKGVELTSALVSQVLDRWVQRGTLPKGFKVKAVQWYRGDSRRRAGRAESQREINAAVRRLLRRIPFKF